LRHIIGVYGVFMGLEIGGSRRRYRVGHIVLKKKYRVGYLKPRRV
jgi:hypothetical protein